MKEWRVVGEPTEEWRWDLVGGGGVMDCSGRGEGMSRRDGRGVWWDIRMGVY